MEQLVEVPVPSFDQCTCMAFFRDGGGRRWCLLTGPEHGRYSWWLVGTEREQENPPPGTTASPGRYKKYWARLRLSPQPHISGSHLFYSVLA